MEIIAENNTYHVVLPSFETLGTIQYHLSAIAYNDSIDTITKDLSLEVFGKDPLVTVTLTEDETSNQLTTSLQVADEDQVLQGPLTITWKANDTIIKQTEVSALSQVITSPTNYYQEYQVTVTGTTKQAGEKVKTLFEQILTTGAPFYQLDTIEDIHFYDENGKLVEQEKITTQNYHEFVAEIIGTNSRFYTTISSIREEKKKLHLTFATKRFLTKPGQPLEVTLPFQKTTFTKLANTTSVLLQNLRKFMPYYDEATLLNLQDLLPPIFSEKKIKTILPYREGKAFLTLTEENKTTMEFIRIVFEDQSTLDYSVQYTSNQDGIVNYWISDLKIPYNYKRFVLPSTSFITELTASLDGTTFDTLLESVLGATEEPDIRLYQEQYEKDFLPNRVTYFEKLLSTQYAFNLDHPNVRAKIRSELNQNKTIETLVFGYNYLHRWYRFSIGGILMSDALYFDDSMLEQKITSLGVSNLITHAPQNQRKGANTHVFFQKQLAPYVGYATIADFLESFMKYYDHYEDTNDWFQDHFTGILVEMKPTNEAIHYRAWDYIKNNQVRGGGSLILPILSLGSPDLYLLSVPSQLCIGSLNVYPEYQPGNPATREVMRQKIIAFGTMVSQFYDTPASIIDTIDRLNNTRQVQFDRRYIWGKYQEYATTEEPVIKNLYGPMGTMAAQNGSAAYANGSAVYWVVYQMLNQSFSTFTHETGHNQDARIFLEGHGRRGGAEDYADGNTTQSFGGGELNFNLATYFSKNSGVTANLTPARIHSKEQIADFYQKMFETINFLDYVEGKAFLNSSNEVKSKVGTQHFYPNLTSENATTANAYVTSSWRKRSEEDYAAMNLTTFADLWDNHIQIKQENAVGSVIGAARYGGATLRDVSWYQPHNDYGRPDSYSFKRLAWEMLSVGGYTGGYVTYYSNMSANDLDGLRKVTGKETITWKEYKLSIYDEIEKKLDQMTILDTNELIALFQQAFELDTKSSQTSESFRTNLRMNLYRYLQRATNDFTTSIYEPLPTTIITSGSQLIEAVKTNPYGNYQLANSISFQGIAGNNSLTDVDFIGTLDGNGYSISGLSLPLFNSVKYSFIKNLVITDSNITINEDNLGAIAKTSSDSFFFHLFTNNLTVSSKTRTGGIVGSDARSFFQQIGIQADIIIQEDRGGGILAETNQTAILNSYSSGTVTQLSNQSAGGWHVGGLLGRLYNNSGIHSCYSASTVFQKNPTPAKAAGGLFGKSEGARVILNSFAIGNGENLYRFDGHSNRSDYQFGYYNNFEYELGSGRTNQGLTDFSLQGKINVVTKNQLMNASFYWATLHWNPLFWDVTGVENGMLPQVAILYDPNKRIVLDELTSPKEEPSNDLPEIAEPPVKEEPIETVEQLPIEAIEPVEETKKEVEEIEILEVELEELAPEIEILEMED